ncbi:hypothetical protein MPSEU_000402300 [Mayamaea pseudoterrestris]|nr:hypothetical protein MPSEU_000402300 [Mayamaea pseudoterrestris]
MTSDVSNNSITKQASAARDSSWDTQAFERGKDWKDDSASPATKLQDLSLVDDQGDVHMSKTGASSSAAKTWPFEEPCAWNGASNTRPTKKAQRINEEYFDPNFVEHEAFDEESQTTGSTSFHQTAAKAGAATAISKNTHKASKDDSDDDDDDDDDSSSSNSSSSSSSAASSKDSSESGASFGVDDDDDEEVTDPRCEDEMLQESPPKKRPDFKPTPNKNLHHQVSVASRLVQQQQQSSLPKDDAISANSMRGSASGYNSMLAWNRKDMDESMDLDGVSVSDDGSHDKSNGQQQNEPRRGQRRTNNARSADHPVADPSQPESGKLQRGASKRNLVKEEAAPRRTTPSASTRNVAAAGKDELSASCHGNLESNRTRKRASARKDELASTVHVDTSASASRSKGPGSAGRHVPRTKSFDGTELGSGPRQDLGTTVHGSSQISRIRSGGKRQDNANSSSRRSSATKQDPRRGVLKRAMSTRNVKPPEDYAQGLDSSSSRHTTTRASGRFRMQRGSSVRQVVPPEQPSRPVEDGSRPRLRRAQSSSSVTLPRRRDLLVLVREKKKVTKADLLDKENRRLLHFLMYEHKMGIPHAILLQQCQSEQASGSQLVRKMDYPTLFIDAGL